MLKFRRNFTAMLMIVAMIFVASGCSGSTSKMGLFINAKAGDSYKYHTVMTSSMNMEAQGQKATTSQELSTDYSVKVDAVDEEGNFSMNYTYDAVKLEADENGVKKTYDSKGTEGDETIKAIYGSVIGKTFSAKMTKSGEIKELSGMTDIMETMVNAMKLDASMEEAKGQLMENLKGTFGDEAIMKTMEQTFKVLPQSEVKIGDSWEYDYEIKTIIPLDLKVKYTFKKLVGDIAHVNVEAQMGTNGLQEVDFMGMKVKSDMKGSMTGTIKVNINNAFLTESETEQDIEGKIIIPVPEKGDMEMPIKSKTKVYATVTQ